ncbi:hypothetical protein RRG08_005966 [Elysia crispata]|uniref:Uncharacterized protein n=1 Tax=Elysia crispata TaxID=231223 RepID=A0AAE0YPL2_9GAST|nr:hypothetical protein RRG08_005966 [Elysia crispata]
MFSDNRLWRGCMFAQSVPRTDSLRHGESNHFCSHSSTARDEGKRMKTTLVPVGHCINILIAFAHSSGLCGAREWSGFRLG